MDNKHPLFFAEIREPQPPTVSPWKTIELEPDFSGQWLVAGDLDKDPSKNEGLGDLEFVTARNHNQSVTAMSAYKLDGTLLWKWGQAGAGGSTLTYDVPVQIYDIDGDGKNEVIFSEEGFLVILDGSNGKEINRYPLPEGLRVADCITFANLRGRERASDIIIKTRYTKLWAYTSDWKELWNWTPKDGYKTCHHPTPIDLDGDGRDEIMAGYTMVDDDGTEIWTFSSEKVSLSSGHLDCCRVVETGNAPEEFRFVVTYCGANLIAFIDGAGNTLWEISGHHFESADAAAISPDFEGEAVHEAEVGVVARRNDEAIIEEVRRSNLARSQIFVDIDHRPYGDSPGWLIGIDGTDIGTYMTNYSRHHCLVDWNGDGLDEIVLANALTICDGLGNRVASFDLDGKAEYIRIEQRAGDPGPLVSVVDVTGNGVEDIVLHTDRKIFVFANPSQTRRENVVSDTKNFTLY